MQLKFFVTLVQPPANLVYGLQKGSGSKYESVQVQQSGVGDLHFDFVAELKGAAGTNEFPDFKGSFVQGPLGARFVYLDIGTYAGYNLGWSGRLKIPLYGISWALIAQAEQMAEPSLETTVPGTGKNGMQTCATVKPFVGWKVKG